MMFYDDEKDVDDKSKHGNMCHLYESSLDSFISETATANQKQKDETFEKE